MDQHGEIPDKEVDTLACSEAVEASHKQMQFLSLVEEAALGIQGLVVGEEGPSEDMVRHHQNFMVPT